MGKVDNDEQEDVCLYRIIFLTQKNGEDSERDSIYITCIPSAHYNRVIHIVLLQH